VAAALPAGAVLEEVRSVRAGEGGVQVGVTVRPEAVEVSVVPEDPEGIAWGFRPAPAALALEALNQTLDAIYRGDPAARENAARDLGAAWPGAMAREADVVQLNLTGPWEFGGVFPAGARFTSAEPRFLVAEGGGWTFRAEATSWSYSWGGQHFLGVDRAGVARLDVTSKRTPAEAQELVRSAVPDYPWTFQGFRFEAGC
jgi:hypothetical protein